MKHDMTRGFEQLKWVAALCIGASLVFTNPAPAADYSETCRYFAGQAFKDRRARRDTTFRMDLAQDCVDAQIYQRSEDSAVRARAESYLAQLQRYREIIVGLLVARARSGADEFRAGTRYVRPAVDPTSWAGEYLIARRMGLVDTHEDWTEWRQSVASTDPRFRVE